MLCNICYPIRKDRQSHRQILIIDDQNLTVLDFLDSCLTGTTLRQNVSLSTVGLFASPKRLEPLRLVAQSTSNTSCFIFALTWSTSRRKVPELDDNELKIDVNIGSFDFEVRRKAPG